MEGVLDLDTRPVTDDGWSARISPWLPVAAIVALPLGVLAFFLHPALGLAALAVLLAPLFVVSPETSFLLLVAALPFDAVGSLGPPGTATITRLVGFAVMGGWLTSVLLRRERIRLGRPGFVLLAFVLYSGVSLTWTRDLAGGIAAFQLLVQLFVLYLMVVNLNGSWRAIRRGLDVLLISTVVVAVVVFLQLPAMTALERATLRFGEEAFNPNRLAAALVLPVLAGMVLGRARATWWRTLAVVPIVVAALTTGSRGATLALLAGALVLLVARPRALLEIAALGTVVGALALAFVPPERLEMLRERYENVARDRGSGRIDIWKVGLAMIEHQPLQGVGLAGFQPAFYGYMGGVELDPEWSREVRNRYGNRGAHNVYLKATAELGLLGAALLVAALATHAGALWRVLRRAQRAGDRNATGIALAVACTFGVLLALCVNGDILGQKSTWMVLGWAQAVVAAEMGRARIAAASSAHRNQAPERVTRSPKA